VYLAILSQRRSESTSHVEMLKETPHADALTHGCWCMSRLPQKDEIPSINFPLYNFKFKLTKLPNKRSNCI
jgi:hypothetical protein